MPRRLTELELAPRARVLLDGLLRVALEPLPDWLAASLAAADKALFRLASAARDNRAQTVLLDARRALGEARTDVSAIVSSVLEAELAAWLSGRTEAVAAPARPATLSLVDSDAHEQRVAFERRGARTEPVLRERLVALSLRLAAVASRKPAPFESLPLGAQALARALSQAVPGIPDEARDAVLDAIERGLLAQLDGFYERLEQHFIEAGVLPHLQRSATLAAVATAGERAPALEPRREAAARDPESTAPRPPNSTSAGARSAGPDFGALRQAVERLGGRVAAGRAADARQLAAALDELQARLARGTADAEAATPLGERLRAALAAHAPAGETARGLSADDAAAAEVVHGMFRSMAQEMPVGGMAQQVLNRLQLPLFRTMLSDRDSVTRAGSPVRRLLGTLMEVGAYWQDVDAESRSLLDHAGAAVDRVVADTSADVNLIEAVENELSRRLRALSRRAELTERRQVEAAVGRERMENARRRAEDAIHHRLAQSNPPRLARLLLENAWTDVLALTLLRHPESSEIYRRRLEVAEYLAATEPQASQQLGSLREDMESGLSQVGFRADEIQALVGRVLDAPDAVNDSGTDIEAVAERVRSRFAEQRRSERAILGDGSFEPRLILEPAERAALDRVRELKPGTWVRFRAGPQGEQLERKLAWTSASAERCLFVNRRGVKVDERGYESLAREIARGTAVVLGPKPESRFDRSWRRFTGSLGFGPAANESE